MITSSFLWSAWSIWNLMPTCFMNVGNPAWCTSVVTQKLVKQESALYNGQ